MSQIREFISASLVQNLAKELLNEVQKTVGKVDDALYKRKTLKFRDVVDSSFPTMLVIDYNNIRKELKLYQDIERSLQKYVSEEIKPTASDYSLSKLTDDEIDILLEAIRGGAQQVSATSISYKELQKQLNTVIRNAEFSNTTVAGVKKLFSKIYRLTDPSLGSATVFIFPNFARIGDILRRPLENALSGAIALTTKKLPTLNKVESVGQILAYGHTAAGYLDDNGNAVLNFNSPKMLAIMFEVLEKSSANSPQAKALEAATFFVDDTRQTEAFLSIDKEFSNGFVKMFVSVGGNIVRFENSLVNSRRGSVLETKVKEGANKAALDLLASAFVKTESIVGKRLARYLVNNKSSPNVLEYLKYNILNAIEGKKVEKYKSSKKESTTSGKKSLKKEVVAGIAKSTAKIQKPAVAPTKLPTRRRKTSLAQLQGILDSLLVTKIKQNMGDGSRRDILNLRSGRFAESVKVERLSESREQMITAFYTYMKNPYATFSAGGRQQLPRSRDPKLLIGQSIREIMQQQAITRLRAVSL